MPSITPDLITAIASVVSAAGIIILWYQIKKDHERSRRENAVNQITRLTEQLHKDTAAAVRLVEALKEKQQVSDLFNYQSFTVEANENNKRWLSTCLEKTDIKFDPFEPDAVKDGRLLLPPAVVTALRWKAMDYLNAHEAVMAAWLHNVADRKIITEQCGYLIDDKRGFTALANLRAVARTAAGEDSYPGLTAFVRHLKSQRGQSTNEGSDPI